MISAWMLPAFLGFVVGGFVGVLSMCVLNMSVQLEEEAESIIGAEADVRHVAQQGDSEVTHGA